MQLISAVLLVMGGFVLPFRKVGAFSLHPSLRFSGESNLFSLWLQQNKSNHNRDHLITQLRAGGGGGGLFGSSGKGFGKSSSKPAKPDKQKQSTESDVVLKLVAKEVKVGPLRFLLQVFLAGDVANKPEKNSWLTQQSEDGRIEVYFRDGTGMLSIELEPKAITMARCGANPSLVYRLQESVLMHSILDELNAVAFEVDEDIEGSKRLPQFKDDQEIVRARKTLPARSEK